MGARSDTIIIVHIPATLDRAYLISIPRDLRVNIPPTPAADFGGALDKINASFQDGGQGAGGVQLLSETLTQLTGVRFDGAAVVDFGGFDKIVQDLGGVHLCIDETVKSIHTGHVFHTGCQDLTANADARLPAAAGDAAGRRLRPAAAPAAVPPGDLRQDVRQRPRPRTRSRSTRSSATSASAMTVDLNGVPLDQLIYTLRNVQPSSLVGVRVPSDTRTIGGVSYVLQTDVAASLY